MMKPCFISQMNFAKMKSVDTAHLTKQKHLTTKMCTRLTLLHKLILNSCQSIYVWILNNNVLTGHNSVDLGP